MNADSLKPAWKAPAFCSKLYYNTNIYLFSPVSVAMVICVSVLKSIFAVFRRGCYIWSGVPLCCLRLVATGQLAVR